jgi:hypothetical protein
VEFTADALPVDAGDAVATITATPSSVAFTVLGETAQITATARDGSGSRVWGADLAWRSLNTSVATVNTTGRITAQSVGTTKVVVTATCCNVADTVLVTVSQEAAPPTVDHITLTPSPLYLQPGGAQTLTARVYDQYGSVMSGAGVNWSSTNTPVATVNSSGRVTAVAVGSAQIRATSGGKTGTAAVTVTSPGGGDPPSGVWFEEDWDYSSTSDMLGQSHLTAYEYGARPVLETGLSTPWGGSKAFKVPMTPSSYSGGIDVVFPKAGVSTSREIWQETYIKFSSNWKTDFGGSGNPDHKTFFWMDRESSVRWELKFGVYGSSLVCFSSAEGTPRTTNSPNLDTEVWDGEWHQVRVHVDMGSGGNTAAYEMWFDGVKRCGSTSLQALSQSIYWNKTSLGRNLNQRPNQNQTVWYGRTRVWISDPGWN